MFASTNLPCFDFTDCSLKGSGSVGSTPLRKSSAILTSAFDSSKSKTTSRYSSASSSLSSSRFFFVCGVFLRVGLEGGRPLKSISVKKVSPFVSSCLDCLALESGLPVLLLPAVDGFLDLALLVSSATSSGSLACCYARAFICRCFLFKSASCFSSARILFISRCFLSFTCVFFSSTWFSAFSIAGASGY